ncbi:DNA gyrase/topoisomerase IV subunit A [Paeniglutamicibacter cryotolerans]|uniref:DNA topoisomerase (ATP-hydrolyzing) n=1 Tax=Paeniglutamicibacter cryotolerans TaxID=670079 RepID=A0A839QJT9_9MICC|nr:DNA topoisomerase IV subunit A [Paeniglutamicibacter cryotolerans]MBB2996678.1 DNA gyrase subunit A [Paeniglutamicibacter cryotolerans]
MARRKQETPAEDFVEHIVDIDVTSEMEGSFLEYAYSVIYSRALPDARDGLKPVQRRILYMMSEMGLRPDKGHVKSARVVGEVMGKLHPHGDTAIYDAMVRMSQSFALRLPLIDGHGNFGSLDDGPAAPRYTEARLDAAAVAMTGHLDEDVVDFVPNYDNQFMQPKVLPAAFPNLLVNGTTGIAVGMATNMAPHNLGEVIAAARFLIEEPDATLAQVMKFIPGPDLPTGGIIVGLDGIKDAYATGRGSFKTRAKVALEQITARRAGLVVTELPYMVGPEKVIEKIKAAVTAKKLLGIADVVDLTDRKNGLRLVIELKNGFNPNAVLASLYKHTPMEDSFGINNVALVQGQPRTLGLLELLQVYVGHRLSVVRRRTAHRLAKKQARLHLVEGLLTAIVDIDEVIAIIRSSDETAMARTRLMGVFDLSEIQASHILELRLRQLTKYSRIELEAEAQELRTAIAELQEILDSEPRLRALVSAELQEVADAFATPRRTVLLATEAGKPLKGTTMPAVEGTGKKAPLALEITDDPCWVLLSGSGQVARTSTREPFGDDAPRAKHDVLSSLVPTSARGEIGGITSTGRMLRLQVVDLPMLPDTNGFPQLAGGVPIGEFAQLAKGEKMVALVPLNTVIGLGTAAGVVKRLTPDYPLNRDEWEAITLKGKDVVIGAAPAEEEQNLVFVTTGAQLLHYPASAVRPQGRTAGGMAGVKLPDSDAAVFFGVLDPADPQAVVVTIANGSSSLPGTGAGTVKVTAFDEYPAKGRATGGVRAHRFLKGEDELTLAWVGRGPARASSTAGVLRALPTEHGRRDGSGVPLAQGIDLLGGLPSAKGAAGTGPQGLGSGTSAGLPAPGTATRAPLAAPETDSVPFAGSGVVEVETKRVTPIQDSLLD